MDQEIREEIRDQVIKQEVKQMIREGLLRSESATPERPVASPTSASSSLLRQQKPEEVRKLVDLRPAPPPTFQSPAARKSTADVTSSENCQRRINSGSNGEHQSFGARGTVGRASDRDSYNGGSVTPAKAIGGLPPSGSNGGGAGSFAVAKRSSHSDDNRDASGKFDSSQAQPWGLVAAQQTANDQHSGNSGSNRINFGHIDDSVNVKERASRFGSQNKTETPAFPLPLPATLPTSVPAKMRTLSVGSAAVSTSTDRKTSAVDSDRLLRKFSAPSGGGAGSGHAATSPNKIKNMTAIFEQKH